MTRPHADDFGAVPLSRRLTVQRQARRRARGVRLLAGTADWRREIVDRLGAAAVVVAGPARLRPVRAWTWPSLTPTDLVDALHIALPDLAPLHLLAAAAPRQPGRERVSILGELGGSTVVVKLGAVDDGVENEAGALTLLTRDPLPGIATPAVIASGRIDDALAFLVTDAVGLGGQRPAIGEPLRTFESDLAGRLGALPKPPGTAAAHVPVHGDLAPWNLRRTSRGLALFDWEAAGWGPPGSDLEHYRSTCDQLRRPLGRRRTREQMGR